MHEAVLAKSARTAARSEPLAICVTNGDLPGNVCPGQIRFHQDNIHLCVIQPM